MDWIALFVAATILAAAAAMIVIALTLTSGRGRRSADRTALAPVRRATPPDPSLVTMRSTVSPDEARAMRADRLKRRPEPEAPRRSVLHARARHDVDEGQQQTGVNGNDWKQPGCER